MTNKIIGLDPKDFKSDLVIVVKEDSSDEQELGFIGRFGFNGPIMDPTCGRTLEEDSKDAS